MNDFLNFTKVRNNVGNLGKIIVATSFELLPKVKKLPNLVTLGVGLLFSTWVSEGKRADSVPNLLLLQCST